MYLDLGFETLDSKSCELEVRELTAQTLRAPFFSRKGGWYGWKPSSSSNFSIRAFRAYPLVETRQTVPCRAIRGDRISVSSTLPPSYLGALLCFIECSIGYLRPISLLSLSLLKIAWLRLSRKFPVGLGIPLLKTKVLLESNPLQSRILVRRLAVAPRRAKTRAD